MCVCVRACTRTAVFFVTRTWACQQRRSPSTRWSCPFGRWAERGRFLGNRSGLGSRGVWAAAVKSFLVVYDTYSVWWRVGYSGLSHSCHQGRLACSSTGGCREACLLSYLSFLCTLGKVKGGPSPAAADTHRYMHTSCTHFIFVILSNDFRSQSLLEILARYEWPRHYLYAERAVNI